MFSILPQTHKSKSLVISAICIISAVFLTTNVRAQVYCQNESIIFTENFGTGSTFTSSPDVFNLNFTTTGYLNDGDYRIADNTEQRGEWHNAPNHTPGDPAGKMLVVNGNGEDFYTKTLTNAGNFTPGNYAASLYLMNVNEIDVCGPEALLPTITFRVEYSTTLSGGTWTLLSTVTANSIPKTVNPVWNQLGSIFNVTMPNIKRLRITLNNGTAPGCGNDFAIDDIQVATCPEGAPLPVQFLGINAAQKGSGVNVSWSTSFEQNNQYFNVERSVNGTTWETINTVASKGNSSVVVNYSAYDAKPNAGVNLYRIKQFDLDGRVSTSSVAKIKVNIDKTTANVLANPFINDIVIDFLSKNTEMVSVRVLDITGKLISLDNIKVNSGSSRIQLSKAAQLNSGMYILSIADAEGNTILNTKLIKR